MRKGFRPAACALLGAAWVLAAGWPVAASAGSVPAGKPETVGLSAERLQRVHTAMQAQGFADIGKRTPMRTDNIFGLASMSKPITGVAVMMLVESGEIKLSDPVSKFIPEFAAPAMVAVAKPNGAEGYDLVSATRAITVGDLLKHGSGLLSGGLGNRIADKTSPRTPTDTLATYIPKLGTAPLDFQPGTLWRYSGLAGFDVLSRIVEVVSGQTYDKYLDEQPAEQMVTIFFIQGGQAAIARTAFESAVRQAIVN